MHTRWQIPPLWVHPTGVITPGGAVPCTLGAEYRRFCPPPGRILRPKVRQHAPRAAGFRDASPHGGNSNGVHSISGWNHRALRAACGMEATRCCTARPACRRKARRAVVRTEPYMQGKGIRMLLFSTLLDTNATLDADAFIELAIRCNQENRYDFNRVRGIDWKPGTRTARYGTRELSLSVCEYGDDSLDRHLSAGTLERLRTARRRDPRAGNALHGKGANSTRPAKPRHGRGTAAPGTGSLGPTQLAAIHAALHRSHIVAIRHEKIDQNVRWQTDYILNLTFRRIQIQLSRTYQDGAQLEREFSTPWFISFLIDGGYLEPDVETPILNRATAIDAGSLARLGDLAHGRSLTSLPIVYVSRTEDDATVVDADLLASQLKGVAHVMAESSHDLDPAVAQACGGHLATGGGLTIMWPDGDAYKYEARPVPRHVAYDIRGEFLADTVRRRILGLLRQVYVPDEFTWNGVNAMIRERDTARLERQYDSASRQLEQTARRLQSSADRLRSQMQETDRLNDSLEHTRSELKQLNERMSEQATELDEQKRQNLAKDEKLRSINQQARRDDHARRKELSAAAAENRQLLAVADEMLDEQKRQIAQRDELVADLKARVAQLSSQLEELRNENEGMSRRLANGAAGRPLVCAGTERDLFDGEVRDYVLEAVDHELDRCGHDGTRQSWRKVDVLGDVLESNDYRRLHAARREQVRRALTGYRGMTPRLEATLRELGYEVIRGERHYILEYGGDPRYRFTMAKTPSDLRSGDNSATQINRLTQ